MGELQKRLEKLKWGSGRCLSCGKLSDSEVGLYTILKIVEEMRKEYPTEENTTFPSLISHIEKTIILTSKRSEWFEKWLGGELYG